MGRKQESREFVIGLCWGRGEDAIGLSWGQLVKKQGSEFEEQTTGKSTIARANARWIIRS
jgi:hypothetical protein